MVIRIKDHVERCYSNEDGLVIQELLKNHLTNGEFVVLSFKGINSITSSFTNTALIELLDDFDFPYIQEHIHFKDSNKHINSMIKNRFIFESDRRHKKVLSTV